MVCLFNKRIGAKTWFNSFTYFIQANSLYGFRRGFDQFPAPVIMVSNLNLQFGFNYLYWFV